MPNLILLENQSLIAKGLALILEGDIENSLLFTANNSNQLFSYLSINHKKVDLAILDIELGEKKNGVTVAEELRLKYPFIKIIFLTNWRKCQFLEPVFGEYEGYLFKDVHPNELRIAIKAVTTEGLGTYYSQDVINLYYYCMKNKRPSLSNELIETINLIAQGYNNNEIAEALTSKENPLTENSIRERRRKLRYIFSAKNSPHLLAKAFKFGYISPDEIS